MKRLREDKRKAIRYDMHYVNGGYSDGVDIKPSSNVSNMDVTINIYGGNQGSKNMYAVPASIRELQEALLAARRIGDPVASDIRIELDDYYENLRRAISLEVVRLMKDFDANMKQRLDIIVQNINQKYAD